MTGEIILIAIWVLQLGHVVGSRVVGLFTGIPFVHRRHGRFEAASPTRLLAAALCGLERLGRLT